MQGMQRSQKQEVSEVERTWEFEIIKDNQSCTKELRKREIKIFPGKLYEELTSVLATQEKKKKKKRRYLFFRETY